MTYDNFKYFQNKASAPTSQSQLKSEPGSDNEGKNEVPHIKSEDGKYTPSFSKRPLLNIGQTNKEAESYGYNFNNLDEILVG